MSRGARWRRQVRQGRQAVGRRLRAFRSLPYRRTDLFEPAQALQFSRDRRHGVPSLLDACPAHHRPGSVASGRHGVAGGAPAAAGAGDLGCAAAAAVAAPARIRRACPARLILNLLRARTCAPHTAGSHQLQRCRRLLDAHPLLVLHPARVHRGVRAGLAARAARHRQLPGTVVAATVAGPARGMGRCSGGGAMPAMPSEDAARAAFPHALSCSHCCCPCNLPGGPPLVQVANDERPNIRTGLTCPVQDCRVVCDMIVMQAGGREGWQGAAGGRRGSRGAGRQEGAGGLPCHCCERGAMRAAFPRLYPHLYPPFIHPPALSRTSSRPTWWCRWRSCWRPGSPRRPAAEPPRC